MINSFLVANRHSGKTVGTVYAASIQSAENIAIALWGNGKGTLRLFDLRKEFDCIRAGKAAA